MTTLKPMNLFLLLLLVFILGCEKEKMEINTACLPTIASVDQGKWEELSRKKIYFGHQSVGFNIMDGVSQVIKKNSLIKIKIIETQTSGDFVKPLWAHSRIGENKEPKTKVDDFSRILQEEIGNQVDYAFFKFCYIDVNDETDIESVFSYYKLHFNKLKLKYPDTNFIHVTIPLTSIETGFKAIVKKILGKSLKGVRENIKRNNYNSLLINEYKGQDSIFDLAKCEASTPTGVVTKFSYKNISYLQLAPEYTNDGGHLNSKGRVIIAEQLLIFLANLQ